MNLLVIFVITLGAFLLVVAGMAVGVLMGRRAISGSCGGLANQSDPDGNKSCSLCSDPDAACRELGKRMQGSPASDANCEKDCEAEGCSKEAMDACAERITAN